MESKLDIIGESDYTKCKASLSSSEVSASEKQTRGNKKGTRHHASGIGKHSRSVQADHRLLGKREIQSVHTFGL